MPVAYSDRTLFRAGHEFSRGPAVPHELRFAAASAAYRDPIPFVCTPAPTAPVAAAETTAETQPVPAPTAAPNKTDLPRIYYGESYVNANAGEKVSENAGEQVSEIELSSEQSSVLPASLIGDGVSQMVDEHSLRERGYGMTPAEAAAFWKTHKPRVSHVYTSADIARLHRG